MRGFYRFGLAMLVIALMALAPDVATTQVVTLDGPDFCLDTGPPGANAITPAMFGGIVVWNVFDQTERFRDLPSTWATVSPGGDATMRWQRYRPG